jgi:hypothetical protein
VLSHIKKIGISSAASFAFIKFTASGCSENDSFNGDQQCQIIHRRRRQLRRDRRRLLNRYRLILDRFRRWAGDLTIGALRSSSCHVERSKTSLTVVSLTAHQETIRDSSLRSE